MIVKRSHSKWKVSGFKVKVGSILLILSIISFQFSVCSAQQGMNRPYIDDKLFHFGFQLGVNFGSFMITDSEVPYTNPITGATETYHARVSSLMPGFHVGFIADLRMCKYLNLRFTPGMQFMSRTITYKTESGNPVKGSPGTSDKVDIAAIPVYIPLYLKWSAAREANYRPYVIAGGGVSFNVSRDKKKPVMLNPMDYFCEVGFGCDLYLQWFKFCPEITYRIGFANQLSPMDGTREIPVEDYFYTTAISRLTSHCVCLTFNFE